MQNGYTLEMVAAEVRGKLRKASGLERLAAARKARSVTRHITRAAALQEASGRELARAWARYQTEYGEQLNPQRRRQQGWQFRPDGRGQ